MKKKKTFNIGKVSLKMHSNGFLEGFELKRQLDIRECKHIIKDLLGIDLCTKEDFYDNDEYRDYNASIVDVVNNWLTGIYDDDSIMEFAYDCSDENIGMFNLIPIIVYLQKKSII